MPRRTMNRSNRDGTPTSSHRQRIRRNRDELQIAGERAPGSGSASGSANTSAGEGDAQTPAPAAIAVERDDLAPSADRVTADAQNATTFDDLGLSPELLKGIKDVGYEEPTPVQVETIPLLLAGNDVIAHAQTGSGKTAAFGLPIIDILDPRLRQVQALILCPTRELAIQVAEALHKYGRHKEVDTMPIYGGQPYERQFRGLQRGIQIVVGTPGRVMDHMRRGTLKLDGLKFFVLDEADEMLDMGFIEDIEWVLEHAPTERQTALFSATMPPRIVDLAQRYLRDPKRVSVAGKEMTVSATNQTAYEVPRSRKLDALTRILDAETPSSALIFCRTKHGVDELGESLMARGYAVETLHGDLSQVQRDRVMRKFRSGQADLLIATDVAARGLDIPDISHVINFDIPESAEAYVHRIGRTGRAGKAGEAITLVTPRETRWMRQIERIVRARIEPRRLPTAADVAERRREAMKQQIADLLQDEHSYAQYVDTVADLTEDRDAIEVAAAILKLYADETGRATSPEQLEDDVAMFAGAERGKSETGMVRLLLNVGRNQGVRPQDLVGAIANEANIPGRAIGAIDIFDAYAFVDIPESFVERVMGALRTTRIKGRNVAAEIAKPGGNRDRSRGSERDERGNRPGGQNRFVGGVRVGDGNDHGRSFRNSRSFDGSRGGGQNANRVRFRRKGPAAD